MTSPTALFSRVTVLAPGTRIDVALPADVAVADLLPMVLDLARETAPDGGAPHGGWCLARLGGPGLDPAATLASAGVVDGELLQLRHRAGGPPPPVFDDVVDAVAETTPGSYRPWTPATARRAARTAAGLALLLAAVALLRAGPPLAAAAVAGAAAVVAVLAGAVVARVHGDAATGVLLAAAGLPLAAVAGGHAVPGGPGRADLLLAASVVAVLAVAALVGVGDGVVPFVAAATAAGLGALAALAAVLAGPDRVSAAGTAAGTAAVAVGALSLLPRLTLQLARVPLPRVPGSAEDLRGADDPPDHVALERRAGVAHEHMTGLLVGCGAVAATAAVVSATGGPFGVALGAVVAAVLLLRARSYANGGHSVALLVAGTAAAGGLLVSWLLVAPRSALLVTVPLVLAGLAVLALLLGVVLPTRRTSPVLRRAVDLGEAVLIAAVLPLALAVLDLYRAVRQL